MGAGVGPCWREQGSPPQHCPPNTPHHLPQLLSHGFTLQDLLGCATRDDLFYMGIRYPQPTLPLLAQSGWGEQGGSAGGGVGCVYILAPSLQQPPCPHRRGTAYRLWAAIQEHRRTLAQREGE